MNVATRIREIHEQLKSMIAELEGMSGQFDGIENPDLNYTMDDAVSETVSCLEDAEGHLANAIDAIK